MTPNSETKTRRYHAIAVTTKHKTLLFGKHDSSAEARKNMRPSGKIVIVEETTTKTWSPARKPSRREQLKKFTSRDKVERIALLKTAPKGEPWRHGLSKNIRRIVSVGEAHIDLVDPSKKKIRLPLSIMAVVYEPVLNPPKQKRK